MQTKKAFQLRGTVEAVLVGEAHASPFSVRTPKIHAFYREGIKGERHSGTRLADVRETELLRHGLQKGIEVANFRQFSAISVEELAEIQAKLHLPTSIPFGCLGENLVISGIPHLTQLPTGTIFLFEKKDGTKRTAAFVVWKVNNPCDIPGKAIQTHFSDMPDIATHFPKAAFGRRGIVGSVYSSGFVHEDDVVIVCVPDQAIYDPSSV